LVGINSAAAKLAPGTYSTSLRFFTTSANQTVTVPISLVVDLPPPVLKTNVTQLQFQSIAGGPAPQAQTIQVSSSGSPLTANISTGPSWLSVSVPNGSTPFSFDVKVNPAGLAAGTYKGYVNITTGLFSSPSQQIIDVTLNVAIDDRPTIVSIVNAAS